MLINKIITKFQRYGRIKELHTIISQETIRPSSPTPPHLKTHNLSLLDQFAPEIHSSFVLFYANYKNGDTNILKQSLSQTLTQYYPFAGRFPTPHAPYINCRDEGVKFVEAFNDSKLDNFIHKNEHDENLDQLFPYGLSCSAGDISPNLVEVQLNHFAGGGAAVALNISHKVADAGTVANFFNHWAAVSRCASPRNPCFISSSRSNDQVRMPELMIKDMDKVKYVTRRFVFPNSKLNEIKDKVIAMGTCPTNPTRVEVLTSLLYKHAVSSAKENSGFLEPSNLTLAVNIRNKFAENYPETAAGNMIYTVVIAKMAALGEQIRLNKVIAELRKGKMELQKLRHVQEAVEKLANTFLSLQGDQSRVYYTSSLCGIPFYEVDFGWGKPVEVTFRVQDIEENSFILMDTPSRDSIKALVHLPEQEMAILQKDKEFLTYVKDV